jgi:hypothetical protein
MIWFSDLIQPFRYTVDRKNINFFFNFVLLSTEILAFKSLGVLGECAERFLGLLSVYA